MSQFKVLFLGTPEIAVPCLEKLIEDDHFEVVGVITQPDRPAGRKMQLTPSPVKKKALEYNIPVLTPENINNSKILEQIKEWKPESAVVVAFGQILSQEFLDIFSHKAVNIHASLLPRWRGAAPIQRAIMQGDSESGVALQVIVQKLDAGALLGARKINLTDETTAEDLYNICKTKAPELLKLEYADYLRGQLAPQEQDISQVTYAKKIKKEEGKIDWSLPATKINQNIRGLWMWPGSWTLRDGKALKIWRTKVLDLKTKVSPGTIIEVLSESFVVACGQGALEIFEVQPESRSKMSASEYIRGYGVTAQKQPTFF